MTQISTYFAENNRGKAIVSLNKSVLMIDYYDDHDRHFFNEEYPNEPLKIVEAQAEDWALGIKKLEDA